MDHKLFFVTRASYYTVAKDGGRRAADDGTGLHFVCTIFAGRNADRVHFRYDGNSKIYVMPAEGGTPKRLTTSATLGRDDVSDRMGPIQYRDGMGKHEPLIVFLAHEILQRFHRLAFSRSDSIGIATAIACAAAEDSFPFRRRLKDGYNRVFPGSSAHGNIYRGGMADDIWIYDFNTGATENVTNNPAQDICPMWGRKQIYFISDRDNRRTCSC